MLLKEFCEVKRKLRVSQRTKLQLVDMVISDVIGEYFGILAIAPLGEHVGGAMARKAQVRVHLRCNVD